MNTHWDVTYESGDVISKHTEQGLVFAVITDGLTELYNEMPLKMGQ